MNLRSGFYLISFFLSGMNLSVFAGNYYINSTSDSLSCNEADSFAIASKVRVAEPANLPVINSVSGVVSHSQKVTVLGENFGEKATAAPTAFETMESALIPVSQVITEEMIITGVSGTDTFRISGDNFGVKSPAAPWMYDDFEKGANAEVLKDKTPVIGSQTYKHYGSALPSTITYTSSDKYAGNKSVLMDDNISGGDFAAFYVSGQTTLRRYVTYNLKWTSSDGIGSGVWKMDRTTCGVGSNPPYDAAPNFGWGDYLYTNNGTEFVNHGWFTFPTANVWHRSESWYTLSDIDVANGEAGVAMDCSILKSKTNIVTYTNKCTTHNIGTWMSPMIANNVSDIAIYLDNLYIDNTKMRVEIGNNSVFENCTHKEIQIPLEWSNSEILVKYNAGTFLPSENRYLFIVDSTGVASAGYLIGGGNIVIITEITLEPETVTLTVGNTQQLSISILPNNASNKSINWSTSNPAIATVSANGLVSALTVGNAIITATVDGGKTAKANIIVNNTTSSHENIKGQNISLYPNPVHSSDFEININGLSNGNLDIILISMQGRVVYSNRLVVSDNNINLQFENLAQGIYIIRMLNNDKFINQKLIVK